MQISKVILVCVLCGVVGNTFAEYTTISCKYDEPKIKFISEVEFDDRYPNQLAVNGRDLPYSDENGSYKLVIFNTSTIAWIREVKGDTYRMSNFFEINRKTGRITYTFKSYSSYDGSRDERVHRGTCTKMANNEF